MRHAYESPQEHINTVGINGLKSSIFNPQASFIGGKSYLNGDGVKVFEDSGGRHQRLLLIYLSECRYLIRTCELIIFFALFENISFPSDDLGGMSKGKSRKISERLAEVGNVILAEWKLDGLVKENDKHFTIHAIRHLTLRCRNIQRGSGWSRDGPSWEQVEQAWGEHQVLEMLHIMQLLLTLLLSSTKLTRSDTVLAWFRLMKEYSFFEDFESVGEPRRQRSRY